MPAKYYITAVYACARANVNDVICREHCIVIVLNDNQCVAEVAQSFEGRDKLVIVTLVQTDARFVKNVENSRQEMNLSVLQGGSAGSHRLKAFPLSVRA